MFEGTVLENVTVAKPGATREEAAAACAAAQLAEWGGGAAGTATTRRSAGSCRSAFQRADAAARLARAFLRDTDVWLLDEPTSALDARNRDAVMDRLLNDGGRRTVVCILHEPELISRFPVRVFMEAGEVVRVERTGKGGDGC